MKSLRSFERRLEKVEARMKADEEAKAAEAKRGEGVGGLEEVLERSEPCGVCLRIMQERFEVDINGRKRK